MLAGDKVAPACARDRKLSLTCQAHEWRHLIHTCVSAATAQQSTIWEIVCMQNYCSSAGTPVLEMQPSMILLKQ